MLRKVFILNDIVVAISEVGSIHSNVIYPEASSSHYLADDSIKAYVGDLYDGSTYLTPPPVEIPVIIHIPEQVTMRQARLALLHNGILDQVTTAILSLPSPQKEEAQIEWEYTAAVQRNSGLVPTMGAALGLTAQQLDDLFILANTL